MCPTELNRVRKEGHLRVLKGEAALRGVNAALVFAEEVPAKHKVVDEVPNYTAIHPQVSAIDPKANVDHTNGDYLTTIYANGLAIMRLDLISVQIGMPKQKSLTDTGALTASITKSRAFFAIHLN